MTYKTGIFKKLVLAGALFYSFCNSVGCKITVDIEAIKAYIPEVTQEIKKSMAEIVKEEYAKVNADIDKKIQGFEERVDKKISDLEEKFNYKIIQQEMRAHEKFETCYVPMIRSIIYSYKPTLSREQVNEMIIYMRDCFEKYVSAKEFKENLKLFFVEFVDDDSITDKIIEKIQEKAVFKEK